MVAEKLDVVADAEPLDHLLCGLAFEVDPDGQLDFHGDHVRGLGTDHIADLVVFHVEVRRMEQTIRGLGLARGQGQSLKGFIKLQQDTPGTHLDPPVAPGVHHQDCVLVVDVDLGDTRELVPAEGDGAGLGVDDTTGKTRIPRCVGGVCVGIGLVALLGQRLVHLTATTLGLAAQGTHGLFQTR